MNVRNALAALPAAAALVFASAGAAGAQSLPPTFAAQLNAGTAQTGIGPTGHIGAGISAVVPQTLGAIDLEVAGVQLAYPDELGPATISTMGTPNQAALLNAGTAWSGIGRFGVVGVGIAGPLPLIEDFAQADIIGDAAE